MTLDKDERTTILVADDDQGIAESLAPFLIRNGLDVVMATDGIAALAAVSESRPDLVVLDIDMPGKDGRQVLRELRSRTDWIPVILLTRIGDSGERAIALHEGADDYVTKPFDPVELLARITAVLRRTKRGSTPLSAHERLSADGVLFDRVSRRVFIGDQEVFPTPRALVLFDYFLTHPNELLTRNRLLDVVWGYDSVAGTRAVDNRVAELRKLLPKDGLEWIDTVTGEGYRFAREVRPPA